MTYTGEEFLQALSNGALGRNACRFGFVKLGGDRSRDVLFSEDPARLGYIRIPVEMIHEVEHIMTFPSGGQEQFYVRICFKQPADNPAAELFAELLRHTSLQPQPLPPGLAVVGSRPSGPVFVQPQPLPPG
jgi:hypothetical protein